MSRDSSSHVLLSRTGRARDSHPGSRQNAGLWSAQEAIMDIKKTFLDWPVLRQLTGGAPLGRGSAVQSPKPRALPPRTATADKVVQSICPYCAVGCGQRVFVKDGHVTQIEGDPDSPVS